MSASGVRPPKWFWIVSLILLIWNIFGLLMFIHEMTISPVELAELSLAEQDLLTSTPVWVLIAFGIAVFTGVIGCLALLLKRRWAKPLVLISLIAVIAQYGYTLFLTDAMEIRGEEYVLLPISIIITAIFLLGFTNFSLRRGWLK